MPRLRRIGHLEGGSGCKPRELWGSEAKAPFARGASSSGGSRQLTRRQREACRDDSKPGRMATMSARSTAGPVTPEEVAAMLEDVGDSIPLPLTRWSASRS